MKNSINNLKNHFACTEVLSPEQCCAVKGGNGEDIRKSMASSSTTSRLTTVAKIATVVPKG
jgi:hypothetical protein